MGFLLAASVVWGFSFGLIKHVLVARGMDPGYVALVRLALSTLAVAPWLRLRSLRAADVLHLTALGAVQYGLMYVAYLEAYRHLGAHEVALFTVTTPIWVSLIHGLGARRGAAIPALAALLSVAGAACVLWPSGRPAGTWTGFLLVQVSNLCFAFGQVRYRSLMARLPGVSDLSIFALLYAGGTAVAALSMLRPAACWSPPVSAGQALALLYLGLVPSGLCFLLWNIGARRATPGTLAALNNAKVPLAVLLALLLFGEAANLWRLAAGGGVLAAAVWLNEAWVRRAGTAGTTGAEAAREEDRA